MTSAVHLDTAVMVSNWTNAFVRAAKARHHNRRKKGGVTIREVPRGEPRSIRTWRYQIRHQRSIAGAVVKIIDETPGGHSIMMCTVAFHFYHLAHVHGAE